MLSNCLCQRSCMAALICLLIMSAIWCDKRLKKLRFGFGVWIVCCVLLQLLDLIPKVDGWLIDACMWVVNDFRGPKSSTMTMFIAIHSTWCHCFSIYILLLEELYWCNHQIQLFSQWWSSGPGPLRKYLHSIKATRYFCFTVLTGIRKRFP